MAICSKHCFYVSVLYAVTLPKCFTFIALKIDCGANNVLVVVGIYRPPSAEGFVLIAELSSPYFNSEIIVMGDFNIDWLATASDYLKEVFSSLNLSQLFTDPTRLHLVNPSRSSLINLISYKSDTIIVSGVFELDFSNHCRIVCIRDTHLKRTSSCIIVK